MSLKQPPKVITTDRCAAQAIKTIPLVMRFMRTQMRSQSSSFLSVPKFRTLSRWFAVGSRRSFRRNSRRASVITVATMLEYMSETQLLSVEEKLEILRNMFDEIESDSSIS